MDNSDKRRLAGGVDQPVYDTEGTVVGQRVGSGIKFTGADNIMVSWFG